MVLRVITGLRKGFKLQGPKGSNSRPTEDKIKESIFNILEPLSDEEFIALDLFSCTGNIGIEFLSRGAQKVYFSENSRNNMELLKKNLEHTKFLDKSTVLFGDFRKNLILVNENIDYVYIDPPYFSDYYQEALKIMLSRECFKDSLFITEMDRDVNFSEFFDELDLVYEKRYGKKYIKFYRRNK